MIRNYKEEYKTFRRIAQDIVKTADAPENSILYMSFTRHGKAVIKEENKKFLADADIDYELGILSAQEYSEIKLVHAIIEKSICNGTVY